MTDKNNTFSKKIGNTEYIVTVKTAEEVYMELYFNKLEQKDLKI